MLLLRGHYQCKIIFNEILTIMKIILILLAFTTSFMLFSCKDNMQANNVVNAGSQDIKEVKQLEVATEQLDAVSKEIEVKTKALEAAINDLDL